MKFGKLEEKPILLDSSLGKEFGFTSDKFEKMSYLFGRGDTIIIPFICSKEQDKGYFKSLVKSIVDSGYNICVTTPSVQMEEILVRWGWQKSIVWEELICDYVEVYSPKSV